MKSFSNGDHVADLLKKISLVKNCIRNNTNYSIHQMLDETITFTAKNDIKVQIKLFK